MRRIPIPLLLALPASLAAQAAAAPEWRIHDMSHPRPAVVTPTAARTLTTAPPGAVVLFDGRGLSRWRSADGGPAPWTVGNGFFEVKPGSGTLVSSDSFGDVQLHLEWAAPVPAAGRGQDRGNSGVFLMGRYELQILDSYRNDTYADGQAGAMYGQHPPLLNVSRPPGAWQQYDVIFRRPRFSASGALLVPARVTVLQNGVAVQNNVVLSGPTSWLQRLPYHAHPDRLPLKLQDHGFKVRFRNIWALPLPEEPPPPPPRATHPAPDSVRALLAGRYVRDREPATVLDHDGALWLDLGDGPMALRAENDWGFLIEGVDATVVFTRDAEGGSSGFAMTVGGEAYRYERER